MFDGVAMLIYLSIVYVWSLKIGPLGRDYACMAAPAQHLPFLAAQLFTLEMRLFGTWVVGYHLVNLILLFGCMLCLYQLVRLAGKGPYWFGTLAGALFMANPVHSEAVLNLSGVGDLLPCLFALAALWAYAAHSTQPTRKKMAVAVILFALAALPHRQNLSLIFALILFEFIIKERGERCFMRLTPFVVLALAAEAIHVDMLRMENLHPARMFAPLYFIFYPLGYLPETARNFHEKPWLGWLAAGVVLIILWLIQRKAKRPAILFGLTAMFAVRLFQGGQFIDPVHLVGGGQLLLANALFNVAFVAMFHRMMAPPQWRHPIVSFTTILCIVFFALEIRSECAWRHASRYVESFQTQAEEDTDVSGKTLGLVLDYQYFLGAPLCLSDAVAHDTPFSRALPVRPLLPLHYDKAKPIRAEILGWSPDTATVRLNRASPLEAVPWPYELAREGGKQTTEWTVLETRAVRDDSLTVSITPRTDMLPRPLTLPETPQ